MVSSGNGREFSMVGTMIVSNGSMLAYRLSALVAFNGEAHCCSSACVCVGVKGKVGRTLEG